MKVKSSVAMLQLVAAGLLLLGTGCQTAEKYSLTYRLWDNSDLTKFSEPAPNPNLALFDATNRSDVLVQYDAISEKHTAIKRQAYYLRSNQTRIAGGKKPKLVQPTAAQGLNSIPILALPDSATNPPPELTTYAVTVKDGRAFTLVQRQESRETFDLPVYPETSGTVTRTVLTPFAVAGDTVMVSVVSAFVAFILWVQSGAPTR